MTTSPRWLHDARTDQRFRATVGLPRCAYLADQRIVTCHDDGGVHLWEDGTHRGSLVGHTHAALCIDVSPAGSQVATGGEEGVMRIWDIEDIPRFRILPRKWAAPTSLPAWL